MPPPVVGVIGVIGGIGSGKSLVAAEFARHHGYLIAADQLGHAALRQPEIKAQVVGRWGERVLDSTGEIDRKRLGAIVFAEDEELASLEAMTHPAIGQRIIEEIDKATAQPEMRFVVLDAALMLEAGWNEVCDYLVFVNASQEVRLHRLQAARGWTAEELALRENAQMPLDEKRRFADAVIENSGVPEKVAEQVRVLLGRWDLL